MTRTSPLEQSQYLTEVKAQYEDLPYPARNPEDDLNRILHTGDFLDTVNHYCYGGKKEFTHNFRALIAGGGTGDAMIFLAEQLRYCNAEIVYLDFSAASMQVAQARAKIKGLNNVIWIRNSLLELPNLDIGKFDFINCVGVIHHLENPAAGLRALQHVLKEDGVISLMVYAKYGRLSVYHMQDLMKLYNCDVTDKAEKIDNCKRMIAALPPCNWFKIRIEALEEEIYSSDAGLYDLLLHSQDRAYSLPELFNLVDSENLQILSFYAENARGSQLYEPNNFIENRTLFEHINKMDERRQKEFIELFFSTITMHCVFLGRHKCAHPSPRDPEMIPSFHITIYEDNLAQSLSQLVRDYPGDYVIIANHIQENSVHYKRTKHGADLLAAIDGKQTIHEICEQVVKNAPAGDDSTYDQILDEFEQLFNSFVTFDWLLLRHKGVPALRTLKQMTQGR